MVEEGLVDDDWLTAVDVLRVADDVERLEKLVRTHHIHARDEIDMMLLHWACRNGRVMCADWILQNGAEVDACSDHHGRMPIHFAAANGHAGCVVLLLRHGAHIDALCGNGYPPLADAVMRGHRQEGRILLDAGASVELARTKIGIGPWADDFLRGRQACAKAVIAFIGGSDRQHRDVVRLIGELIWNTRGAEEWE